MGAKTEIVVTGKRTLEAIWIVYAMTEVKMALEKKGKGVTAPGFALAAAIVDYELAEARCKMSSEVLREAARAGCDVGRSTAVTTSFKGREPIIEVDVPDPDNTEP